MFHVCASTSVSFGAPDVRIIVIGVRADPSAGTSVHPKMCVSVNTLKGRRLHTLWCILACFTLQSSCYNGSTDSFQSLQVFSYPDLLHFCCQKSLLGREPSYLENLSFVSCCLCHVHMDLAATLVTSV